MKDPRKVASDLTTELKTVLRDRLRSVILYGSVARGEAITGVSDINVMVLVDRVDSSALHAISPLARRWSSAGNTVPLLMTWEEWRSAADSFAIECADMQDAHEVLYGDDPLAGQVVESVHLRLQAERELRGKILQLREGMLLTAESDADVGRLLLVALPSFVTYLRAALRLAGLEVPLKSERTIETGAHLVGADPGPFLRILDARMRGQPLRLKVEDRLVAGYYELAERTASFVDNLSEERRGQ